MRVWSGTHEARVLRPLQAAAGTYRIAFGTRAGQKVLKMQGAMPRDKDFKQTLCADYHFKVDADSGQSICLGLNGWSSRR